MKYNFKHKVQSTGKKLVDCKIYYFYFIGSIVVFLGIISCESHKKSGAEIICGDYNPQIEIVSPAETKQYFNIFILKNEMV